MQLKQTGTQWNRNTRNDINDNWDTIANNFNGAVQETIDEAKEQVIDELVDNAKLTWVPAVENYEDIDTTYPNPEEGWTVNVSSEGNVYRYDGTDWVQIQSIDPGPYNELTSQLAETEKKSNSMFDKNRQNGIQSRKEVIPTCLLVDDDMRLESYDIIFKEFVEGRGVPYAFAAISDRIINGNSLTVSMEQFREIKDHDLTTILNHTSTHLDLSTLSDQEVYEEIKACDDFLRQNGVYSRCLVPPFGGAGSNVYRIAKEFVDTVLVTRSIGTTDSINCNYGDFLDTEPVVRVDFSNSLEELKQMVRWAVDTNGLLIISTHSHYPQDETQSLNFITQKLHDFIDYCELQGLDITDYETAYARFKNVIEYRDDEGELKVGLSAGGKTKGLDEGFLTPLVGDDLFKSYASDPADSFPEFTVTKQYYTASDANTYGFPSSGTLFTTRANNVVYTFQVLYPIRDSRPYMRYWDDRISQWGPFRKDPLNELHTDSVNLGSIDPGDYVLNTIVYSGVQEGDSVVINPNFPLPTGVFFCGHAVNGGIKLFVNNVTSNSINLGNNEWLFRIIRD